MVQHRRTLPGSRAVVGGFLVAAAAVGIFAAIAGAQHRGHAQYVVAAHDLAVGTRLKAGDLASVELDLPQSARNHAFVEAGRLEGSLVIGPVAKGELVQPASILASGKPPPYREVTVAVDAQQVSSVAQGDTVDVLVTTGANESSRTDVVLGGARVLRIGDRTDGIGGDSKPAVTFGLQTFDDVTRIVQASHVGSLTIVRANGFASQFVTFNPSQPSAGNH
jgi:Flp pilus assembly protein CpaB